MDHGKRRSKSYFAEVHPSTGAGEENEDLVLGFAVSPPKQQV